MKKLISILIVLALLLTFPVAFADETNESLHDIQLEKTYMIDGYAELMPVEFKFVDYYAQFKKDADYSSQGSWSCHSPSVYFEADALKGYSSYYLEDASWIDSGTNADFAWLQMNITNLQKKSIDFMSSTGVKVIYGDAYEFDGWIRQANMDYNSQTYRYQSETVGGTFCVLDPANAEPVDMMYTGTYIFGCTLPTAVISGSESLRMVITLDGNEMTYNIRK